MAVIRPNQTFKHETETYEKGQEYEVSDEDAEYFAGVGWVGEPAETGQVHSLDVHDITLGHSSEVN